MRSNWMIAVALVSVLSLFGTSTAHCQEMQTVFTGLWEGVDNVDGSLRTVSIADLDGDGVWQVHSHDTFWTLCNGPQALAVTQGSIEENGVLRTKGTVQCVDGKKIGVEVTYTPQGHAEDGMIVEHVVGKEFRTLLFRINH